MTPPRCCDPTWAASRVELPLGWSPTMSSCPARCDGVMAAASRWPQLRDGRVGEDVEVVVGGRVVVTVALVVVELEAVPGLVLEAAPVDVVAGGGFPLEQPVATRAAAPRTASVRRGRWARALTPSNLSRRLVGTQARRSGGHRRDPSQLGPDGAERVVVREAQVPGHQGEAAGGLLDLVAGVAGGAPHGGDDGAVADAAGDQPLALELPEGPGHGAGGQGEVAGQLADARQPGAGGQRPGPDQVGELRPQLFVGRDGAVGVDVDVHGAAVARAGSAGAVR